MSLHQWIRLVEHSAAIETPAFQKWFSGSKVVDAHGQPLPVFHGTLEDFKVFKLHSERRRAYGLNRLGYWFDVDPQTPSFFAGGETDVIDGGNVMLVYLAIKRPLIFSSEPVFRDDQKILDDMIARKNWGAFNAYVHGDLWNPKARKMDRLDAYDHMQQQVSARNPAIRRGQSQYDELADGYRDEAIAEGYDGILLKDTLADGGTRNGRPSDWWIAFHAHQIKSVYANSGNYSSESDDITEARSNDRICR